MTSITVLAHAGKLQLADRRALEHAFFMAEIKPTWVDLPKAKKATKAARAAVEAGADIVVACGGDGTVRAASEALVDTATALAVFPVGTANLFATGFGLPSHPTEVVALLQSGQRRTIDSGVCNDRTFNVMAGAGFDARMLDDADEHKERYGMLAYVRAGLRHARGNETFDVRVKVDGDPWYAGPAACVLVGNIGTLKAGVATFPHASPTDGVLDVGIVTATGLREWGRVLLDTVRRHPAESPYALIGRGRKIDVRLAEEHRFELDGGCKGTADRLRFSVRPGALTLCAPVS